MLPGCFIHENIIIPGVTGDSRGWWGHNKERRFKMEQTLIRFTELMVGKLVTCQYFLWRLHLASVDMFDEIGMDA
jgi:kynureninase